MTGDGIELEFSFYNDETGQWEVTPIPSSKPLAVRKKAAQAKKPSAGDYLSTLGDMFFVNPRNSAAATLGGAAYDYVTKSTPKSVMEDISESAQDAGDWLRKEGKLIRAAPITETLRLLKAGYIDPLAEPFRVFKQAATERARGNESGAKKLAAMVPFAVAGAVPQLGGTGKAATKAGVDAATKAATKKATKAATKTATKAPAPAKAFADINPDLYGLRKTKDLPRLQASPVKKERFSVAAAPDKVSLGDYEGRPFIISMSDRSAAGDRITGIGDQDLNLPVDLQGGQDFMFSPTTGGLVWASEAAPVSNIMNLARQLYEETGEKPLYLPFRMGGEGSDFATMTGETMMSYADAALGKRDKADMNRLIGKYIPDFAGISDPEGYRQFADLLGDKRKKLQLEMSNTFGEEGGGLTLPMTRAMIADQTQLNKPSFFLQNVGEIDPTADVVTSTGHRTYSRGVPGRGVGVLADDINVAQLLPNLSKIYQIGDPREFRGQYADFTDFGKELKMDEEAAMREKALRQGKTPKVYNTERGGTSKYMQSGAKFGVLTPELLRLLAGE
jgi:hypothetical protein